VVPSDWRATWRWAVRVGEEDFRVFAFDDSTNGAKPPFGAFFWVPIHSGLMAWWLMTAWRVRQMAEAAIELVERELAVARSGVRSIAPGDRGGGPL
jgi:hypothetical protein